MTALDLGFKPIQRQQGNVVFTCRALQRVDNDVQALSEINRALAFDGLAVVGVASLWNATFSILLNRLKIKRHPYGSFHIYTSESLKTAIKTAVYGLLLWVLPRL